MLVGPNVIEQSPGSDQHIGIGGYGVLLGPQQALPNLPVPNPSIAIEEYGVRLEPQQAQHQNSLTLVADSPDVYRSIETEEYGALLGPQQAQHLSSHALPKAGHQTFPALQPARNRN